jgi:hypothetical protein
MMIMMKMGGACSIYGRDETLIGYKIVLGKPEGRRSLARLRHIWEVNVKVHLK